MTPTWFLMACAVGVIGCGLVSGIFMSFSDFVMRALRKSSAAAGVDAMQSINREVFPSVFLVMLWSMLALSVLLCGYAVLNVDGVAYVSIAVGCGLYVIGPLIVSFAYNIPMNDRLQALGSGREAVAYWQQVYVTRWTRWNHVRTATSGGAAVCYLVACLSLAQS